MYRIQIISQINKKPQIFPNKAPNTFFSAFVSLPRSATLPHHPPESEEWKSLPSERCIVFRRNKGAKNPRKQKGKRESKIFSPSSVGLANNQLKQRPHDELRNRRKKGRQRGGEKKCQPFLVAFLDRIEPCLSPSPSWRNPFHLLKGDPGIVSGGSRDASHNASRREPHGVVDRLTTRSIVLYVYTLTISWEIPPSSVWPLSPFPTTA